MKRSSISSMVSRAGLAMLLLAPLLTADAQMRKPPTAAPVCPAGTRLCSGNFGYQCYSPAAGQTCRGGAVCGPSQQLCEGPFGTSCYSPSEGQQCLQGVICQSGQSICTTGGVPHCYSPARGEQCQ